MIRSESMVVVLVPIAIIIPLMSRLPLGGLFHRMNDRQVHSALADEFNALTRERVPTSLAELQPTPAQASQNAAIEYNQLVRLFKAHPFTAAERKTLSHLPENANGARAMQALLARHADALPIIQRAIKKPRCVFQRDWTRGTTELHRQYSAIRRAEELIAARSYVLARRREFHHAITLQAAGFRMARHADEEPLLLAYRTANDCHAASLNGMEAILQIAGPNKEVADEVSRAVTCNRLTLNPRRATIGEMVLDIGIRQPINTRRADAEDLLWPNSANDAPLAAAANQMLDERILLRILRELRTVTNSPWKGEAAREDDFCKFTDRMGSEDLLSLDSLLSSKSVKKTISEDILTYGVYLTYQNDLERVLQTRAREGTLLAGAKLLSYRAVHSAFPDRLESLMPEPPIDPFSGRSLRFEHEGDGFVVHSVGFTETFGKPSNRHEAAFRYPAA